MIVNSFLATSVICARRNMTCFLGACGLVLLGLSAKPAIAAGGCGTSHFRYIDGGVSRTTINVIKNSTCGILTKINDGKTGSNGIRSFAKVVSASHGVIGYTNLNTITYRPDKDYTGTDHFAIRVEYDRGGSVRSTTLEVDVIVVSPH